MVSIRELCRDFRKKHGINTTEIGLDCIKIDFDDIISITPNKAQLVCIGSRPGMGRSALCLDTILEMALSLDKTVLYFLGGTIFVDNLDLLIDRLLRRICGVNDYSIIKNADSETICNNTKNIQSALCILEKLNILFDTQKYPTVDYIKENVLRCNNLGLVVVGNVEYIAPEKPNKSKKVNCVAFIKKLFVMTKETNIPVIITTTLSRLVERRTDKHPAIRDLKYNYLRELSDTIVLLYREAYYSLNKDDDSAEILISKNKKDNHKSKKMRFDHNMIRFTVR